MDTKPRVNPGVGAVLATAGALFMVLSSLLGWTANPRPWLHVAEFLAGVASGTGATLCVHGLIQRRQ